MTKPQRKNRSAKHILSLSLPLDVFDKASMRQDITKNFVEMVRKL